MSIDSTQPASDSDGGLLGWAGRRLSRTTGNSGIRDRLVDGACEGSLSAEESNDLVAILDNSDEAIERLKFVMEEDRLDPNRQTIEPSTSPAIAAKREATDTLARTSTRRAPASKSRIAIVSSVCAAAVVFVGVFVLRDQEPAELATARQAISAGEYDKAIDILTHFSADTQSDESDVQAAQELLETAALKLGSQYAQSNQFKKVRQLQNAMSGHNFKSRDLDHLAAVSWMSSDQLVCLNHFSSVTDLGYRVDAASGHVRSSSNSLSKSNDDEIVNAYEPLITILGKDPQDRTALLNYGYWLILQNSLQSDDLDGDGSLDITEMGAFEIFEGMTERRPDDAIAWLGLGLAKFHAMNDTEALRAFEMAQRLDPQTPNIDDNIMLTNKRLKAVER